MDFVTQRKNMVESQVRPSDVTDRRIMRAMLDIPRELFVPTAQRATVYMDGPVAVSVAPHGKRSMMAPRVLAKAMQLANIDADGHVLVVGGLYGYSAALAARLGKSVVLLEADETIASQAREALRAAGQTNVTVTSGPLADGAPDDAPYDAILVEGAVALPPVTVLNQLKDRGRLVAVLGNGATGRVVRWLRVEGTFGREDAFDAVADYLPGFEPVKEFAF